MFGNKLTDSKIEYNLLKKLESSFKNHFNLTPCLGAELEFYFLQGCSSLQLSELQDKCNIIIKQEKGKNQYEVEIKPSTDIALVPKTIRKMRKLIEDKCNEIQLDVTFNSKPFPNDFGSSMHIHFNFLEDTDAEKYAEILCHYLTSTIKAFLPKKEDYLRLDHKFMAPTHISYGGNNRTTLIRIPDALPRRLEHRLAAADADPYEVIYAILYSIYTGLKYPEKIQKLDKTYGNAYDPQYNLTKIM